MSLAWMSSNVEANDFGMFSVMLYVDETCEKVVSRRSDPFLPPYLPSRSFPFLAFAFLRFPFLLHTERYPEFLGSVTTAEGLSGGTSYRTIGRILHHSRAVRGKLRTFFSIYLGQPEYRDEYNCCMLP